MEPQLQRSELHPCAYLAGRQARSVYFFVFRITGSQYESLLSQGWRRSGQVIYHNDCPDCRLCLQMRVDVTGFQPSTSQRRCQRRNSDIRITITEDLDNPAALDLYASYQTNWHAAPKSPEPEEVRSFLADSSVETVLTLYHLGDRLVGAGWVDVLDQGLSSVYFAFDTAIAQRSLGVFSLINEISLTRRLGKRWLYLGFMVPGSPTMAYKRNYQPHSLLIDGVWQDQPDDLAIAQLIAANPGQPSTS